MGRKLDLLKLQIYRLVDAVDKLVHGRIDGLQDRGLLIDLELELGQQILVKRVLRHLHLVE